MARPDHASTLAALEAQQTAHPLSILTLAEPILESTQKTHLSSTSSLLHQQQNQKDRVDNHTEATRKSVRGIVRPSDASSATDPSQLSSSSDLSTLPTPSTLSADLAHYRELFAKLRFSYLEQVTKEKYLRAIVGDPPILVSHADNVALESELVGQKAELKERKAEVDALVVRMQELSRTLAGGVQSVETQTDELQHLGPAVQELRLRKEELEATLSQKRDERQRAMQGHEYGHHGLLLDTQDPRLNLSLAATQDAVDERRRQCDDMDRQIAELQRNTLPHKMRECEVADRELEALDRRREESVRLAREARRSREEGGRDRVEEMGRWYRSADVVMAGLGLGMGGLEGSDQITA